MQKKVPFLLDTVVYTEGDMLHLPQVYSLNNSKARGLFRVAQELAQILRFPLKQLSHIFTLETPPYSRAAHAP